RVARDALQQALQLPAAVAVLEGVNLVDDDVAEVVEEAVQVLLAVEHEALEALGRDLHDALRALHGAVLHRLADVAVPGPHRDLGRLEEVVEALELVVDQCLERPHVEHPDAGAGVALQVGEDGQERRFGLAAGGLAREQHVLVRVEDGFDGFDLHAAQLRPALPEDELADVRREALERAGGGGHSSISANASSSSPSPSPGAASSAAACAGASSAVGVKPAPVTTPRNVSLGYWCSRLRTVTK